MSPILKEKFCARFDDLTTNLTRLATVSVEYRRLAPVRFCDPAPLYHPAHLPLL